MCRDLIVNNGKNTMLVILKNRLKVIFSDHIHVVEQRLRAGINEGLSKARHNEATVKCFPTYVNELPTGNETGRFLALDLGGTNFRVLLVEIGDQSKMEFSMESKIFAIPKEIMTGTGTELFDHIADCISQFIAENGLHDEVLPLGFTFSFPCKQEGLNVGVSTII